MKKLWHKKDTERTKYININSITYLFWYFHQLINISSMWCAGGIEINLIDGKGMRKKYVSVMRQYL